MLEPYVRRFWLGDGSYDRYRRLPQNAMATSDQREYANTYLSSRRWYWLRAAALKRDGYRCVDCRIAPIEDGFEVHHVRYSNRGREFTAELADLVSLCPDCHTKRHRRDPELPSDR